MYAVNWLNIGSLFILMGPDLRSGLSGLGTLTSTFYLGVGSMQIPGGLLAAKFGPKRTVVTGMLVSSLAVLAVSGSSTLTEAAIFRFVVGSGMALVFAPTVVLTSRFLGNRSGIGAGLINSAFDVGGLLGLFGWILIATVTGWRSSLVLSGTLGLATGLIILVTVPRDTNDVRFSLSTSRLAKILRQRKLVLLGLAALGSNLGSVLISSFMTFYLHSQLGQTAALAALVASLVDVVPAATSIWGGRMYDRSKKARPILVSSGFGMVVALVICSIPTVYAGSLGSFIGGIAVGPSSTVAFAAARDLSGVEREYESLVIGWVNCISLTGSVWPPLVFSYFANSSGYPAAWLVGAGLSLLFLFPIALFFSRKAGKN